MKKLKLINLLLFLSLQVLAQKPPSFIEDIKEVDLTKVESLESAYYSQNILREKFGLKIITPKWNKLEWKIDYETYSITGWRDENKNLGKVISYKNDDEGRMIFFREYDIKDNQLNGKTLNYFEDKLVRIETYKKNALDGKILFLDSKEEISHSIDYKNNLPWEGQFLYTRRGNKRGMSFASSEKHYKKGEKIKEVKYNFQRDDSLFIMFENFYKEGHITLSNSYDKSGILGASYQYGPLGLMHGEQYRFDNKGNKKVTGNYIYGKRHGQNDNYWYWCGRRLKSESEFNDEKLKHSDYQFFLDSIYNEKALEIETVNKWKKSLKEGEDLFQVLKESFFSKNYNIGIFSSALQAIAESQKVELIDSLKNLHKKIEEQSLIEYEYDSTVHPIYNRKKMSSFRRISETILKLELLTLNLGSEKEEITFLLKRIEEKIVGELGYVDAEFSLLHECGMSLLKEEALKFIDDHDHVYMKLIGLNLLQKMEGDSLRPILMNRINQYKGKSPVFMWMIQMIANIGEQPDIDFLVSLLDDNDEYTQMFTAHILWNKKRKNSWIKEWIKKSTRVKAMIGGSRFINRHENISSPMVTKIAYYANRNIGSDVYKTLMGPYFGKYSNNKLIEILEKSKDETELIKAANILGERELSNQLNLSEEQLFRIEKLINQYILNIIENQNSKSISERIIERLWFVAEPTLWKYINENEDKNRRRVASRQLAKMCNINLINKAIQKIERCKNKRNCKAISGLLYNMKSTRNRIFPRRQNMSKKEYQDLFENVIEPIINGIPD